MFHVFKMRPNLKFGTHFKHGSACAPLKLYESAVWLSNYLRQLVRQLADSLLRIIGDLFHSFLSSLNARLINTIIITTGMIAEKNAPFRPANEKNKPVNKGPMV